MKQIIEQKNQRYVVTLIAAAVSLLGMQSLSSAIKIYQLATFFWISLILYLFLVFLQTFIFDLHLKPTRTWDNFRKSFFGAISLRFQYISHFKNWLHYQNYLILPGVIFWATVLILFLNPFDALLKQIFICLSVLALGISFWYLKNVFYSHAICSRKTRQLIFLIKIYAAFIAFAGSFGVIRYVGFSIDIFFLAVFSITFLLFYQAFFQHHKIELNIIYLIVIISAAMGAVSGALYTFWPANFYSAGLVLSAIYSTAWGILHHKFIEKNLTREIFYEYLAVLFVVLVMLIGSTNFGQGI